MQLRRLDCNPIITPDSDPSIGTNINGPSLIRVPEPVHELRDPAVFEKNGRAWLLDSITGESGLAIAEIMG